MSYRFMRAILFFDLPVEKVSQQRAYRKFIKNIKKMGVLHVTKISLCENGNRYSSYSVDA